MHGVYGGMTVIEYCLGAHYIVVIYASQGISKAVGSRIACDENKCMGWLVD